MSNLAPAIHNILVPVDFSECSKAALRYAASLAAQFGATLTLVHVVEPYVYPEDLSGGATIGELDGRWMPKQMQKLEALRRSIQAGVPETVVVTMGSTAERVARHADCPVLVVPS